MTLGEAVKKIRWEMRLSQQALANIIGCTQTAISSYEKEQRKPRYEILKKLDTYAKQNDLKIILL